MKSLLRFTALLTLTLGLGAGADLLAQPCTNTIASGQNLVVNGDFSDGFNGWEFDGNAFPAFNYPGGSTDCASGQYCQWYRNPDPPANCITSPSNCFSTPGKLWVGPTTYHFNQSFAASGSDFTNYTSFQDRSPSADNMMLMIDGRCTEELDAWRQTVTGVVIGETYYFSAWIMPLSNPTTSTDPATLRFKINGTQIGPTITTAGGTRGVWVFFETTWTATATTATIALQNTATTGCGPGVDFALDDIYFAPNCGAAALGPLPDLGPAVTLCGGDGTVTIGSGVPPATQASPNVSFLWSTGEATPQITVSTPGIYTVCVDSAGTGTCRKSAQIEVLDDYTISLPTPLEICQPASVFLDPGHGGPNVSFVWERNGTPLPGETNRTILATVAGTYEVTVTDADCGTKTATSVITARTSAIPNDAFVCPSPTDVAALSVTGTGTYTWWTAETGGTQVAGPSSTYNPTVTGDATFWVQDVAVQYTTVGEVSHPSTGSGNGISDKFAVFEAKQPLTIDTITIYMQLNENNPTDNINFRLEFTNNPAAFNVDPTIVYQTMPQYTVQNQNARLVPAWRSFGGPPYVSNRVYGVKVPVNFTVTTPGTYRLRPSGSGTNSGNIMWVSGGSYPYLDNATGGNVIEITSAKLGGNPYTTTQYGPYYNWQVSYLNACARVPVRAIEDCVLPVEWLGFQVAKEGEGAVLTWQTASQVNSSHFVVERSLDGVNFEAIGVVAAAGTTTQVSEYQYWDAVLPASTVVYYRLRQLDLDGSEDFSPVRSLTQSFGQIVVVPNPVSQGGSLSVSVPTVPGQSTEAALYDMLGRVVFTRTLVSQNERASFEIPTANIAEGTYVLRVVLQGRALQTKVVVTR